MLVRAISYDILFPVVLGTEILAETPQANEEAQPQAADLADNNTGEEFDLSDISAKPQSREDIIAAAEEKAFAES